LWRAVWGTPVAGAIGGFLLAMDARTAAAKRLLGAPFWVDYAIAGLLPVCGFLVPRVTIRILVWIWAGFSEQPGAAAKARRAASSDGKKP
jgi:hypothetical protein